LNEKKGFVMDEAVILSVCRTPIGSFGGTLSSISAPKLGAIVIEEAVQRTGISKEMINEVIMGNVVQAGVGQAPARQAAIYAGLPESVECMTINKVCGSGMKALMLASQTVSLGDSDIIVAGGMESMSNAPFLLPQARYGYRYGNGELQDSLLRDGLQDIYKNVPMGNFAELCAKECSIPREAQDEFAILSYKRAQDSIKSGRFTDEIIKVTIPGKKGEATFVADDEEPFKTNFDKIPTLRPAFQKDGTVTAANSSKINDGAAAVVVSSIQKAKELGVKPLAKIIASATFAKAPEWFTTAPIDVIAKTLKKANLTINDIDLFEINEAFAVVALAVNKIAGIDIEKINVNGGAVALGHPIGASGARIVVTLINALKQRKLKRGMAAICIGGGEACGIIIELV
jgi:acetyl-CoA C-acetyltransferase